MTDRDSEAESAAEQAGVVDQQGAAAEKMDDNGGATRSGTGSAPERAGAVDQQGAIADDVADEE